MRGRGRRKWPCGTNPKARSDNQIERPVIETQTPKRKRRMARASDHEHREDNMGKRSALPALGLAASAFALVLALSPAGAMDQSAKRRLPDGSYRVAQACGWYAIYSCSHSRREAGRFSREHGIGYVIDTSDPDYPNLRNGYYCVVEGPMSRGRALSFADRASDFAPTAYAKSAC
jgi:hypothetical protein